MFRAAKKSLSYLTPSERRRYFMFIGLRSLTALLDVAGILLIGLIASVGASQFSGGDAGPTTIGGITIPPLGEAGLLWLVIFALAVFVVKALIAVVLIRRMTLFIARVETANTRGFVDMVLSGSLDTAKRYSKAELQFAVGQSTTSVFSGVLSNVATVVSEGFLLLIVVASFFFVNPVAAIFTLIFFGIVVLAIQFVIEGSIRRAGRDASAGLVDTTNAMGDSLDSFREISVLGKKELFLDRLAEGRGRLSRAMAMFNFLGGMPRYVVETALILGVVIFVGQQFASGELATGFVTIGVFITGGVRMMASLLPLQNAFTGIKLNAHQGELASGLLDEKLALDAQDPPPATEPATPAQIHRDRALPVAIHDARFRYPNDAEDTLHDIDLDVAPGAYVAIIGPSGAGKTTLVDLMLGLIPPASGTVLVDGIAPKALRQVAPGLVAYVPQKPGMVSGTIAENIALGVPVNEIDRTLLGSSIDAAHLTEFLATLPDGADTSVGAQVDSLSGGQIQRIGLARALYSQPRLLILDEATSALDAGSEAFIADTLRHLHGDVTVVVIAHRLSTVQHADLVHVIQDGRITASGDFKTLRKSVPMVAEYVKLMSFDEPGP
ncbi:MAG: ABC transporter ATP-binding protein [Pseudolysinimonas sp.]